MRSKITVISVGVVAAILPVAFLISVATNSYLVPTLSTPTSYTGLCDRSLVTEPTKHSWDEYVSFALTSAEAGKNEPALFCFLLGKIYSIHKFHSGEVDTHSILNNIVPVEGYFTGLFAENPERGIEIVNAALAWNQDFGVILTPANTALLEEINDVVVANMATLRNDYKIVQAQNAGITYTLEDLKEEGVLLPKDGTEFVETRGYYLDGKGKNIYYKTDLNLDGVDDVTFLTADDSARSFTAVLNIKKETAWIPYTLSHLEPSSYNSGVWLPNFYTNGNGLVISYQLDTSGQYTEYNIGHKYLEMESTSATVHLYTEFKNEVPVITKITTDFEKLNGKGGSVLYEQQFDLKRSLYERQWRGFGNNADRSDIEEITNEPISFKPIPWSEFTNETLAEILRLAK